MKKIIIILILINFIWAGSVLAGQAGDIDIHGFVSQGYLKSGDNNFLAKTEDGTFEFNEMGINFGTWPTADLHLGIQFFARDLGDMGNDEITLDWAYADYHYRTWLGLRAGKMKSPMGLYNETRDIDMLRVSILLPQGAYNEGWRDSMQAIIGLSLYGKTPSAVAGSFEYEAQVGSLSIPDDGGISKFIDTQAAATTTGYDDLETNYVLSFRWNTPLDGLRFGYTCRWFDFIANANTTNNVTWQNESVGQLLNAMGMTAAEFEAAFGFAPEYSSIAWAAANIDPALAQTDLVGLPLSLDVQNQYHVYSVEFIWDELTLAAEFAPLEMEYEMFLAGSRIRGSEIDIEGWYCSAAYRFSDLIEAGIYYSYFCPDTNDRDGDSMNSFYGYPKPVQWSKDWCLSLRLDLNDYWIVKLEGHMIDGLAVMYIEDQELNSDGSYDVDDEWMMFGIKATYSF